MCWVQSTVWIQPTCLVSAHLWACFQNSSSQPCLLMKLDSGVSNTLKEERKLGEAKSKGHSALRGELKRLKKKEEHGESVRGWKKKNIYIYIYIFFSLLKLHIRKINWLSSLEIFEFYNHRKLECSKEDFATGFIMRLYLLLEI